MNKGGGINSFLMDLYRNIDRDKIQFDFLVHRAEIGSSEEEIIKLGGKIYRVPPINPFHHRGYLVSLKAFFENHKEYQIIHAHNNAFSMYPLRAAKRARVPIRIAHSHTALKNKNINKKTVFILYTKSKIKKYSTHFFACSDIAGQWLFGKDTLNNKNYKTLYNAIDMNSFIYNPEKRIKIRELLGLEGKFVIGHVGRLNPAKNYNFLLKIVNEIFKKDKDAVLLQVGVDQIKGAELCKNIITETQNQDKVIFAGMRNDVNDLMQAMDIFLFPSLNEGLPVTLIEAQAMGLPCIVSKEGVSSEIYITDYIKGVSLKKSSSDWADIILYTKSENCKERNSNSIRGTMFDIKFVSKWLEEFYLGVL
ncbi:MAG: glycosyltransferase [Eubacteriales bacterium]|nr:glycosyltransferase [Eubacteriales bacterium]